jgi:hypothetical protein
VRFSTARADSMLDGEGTHWLAGPDTERLHLAAVALEPGMERLHACRRT